MKRKTSMVKQPKNSSRKTMAKIAPVAHAERPTKHSMRRSQICFRGSYIDGAEVDVVAWAGLSLDDAQHDALWGNINVTSLVELTDSGFVEIEKQVDDAPPGMNDTYYAVVSFDG